MGEEKTYKVTYKNGDVYSGHLVKNLPHGEGETVFANGNVFKGEHYQGFPWKGTFTYTNGDVYKGTMRIDKPHGYGHYFVKETGQVHKGYLKKGFFSGEGTLYDEDGKIAYKGGWKKDEKHGKGVEYYGDGGRYEGDFKRDCRHGKGTLYFPEGHDPVSHFGKWKNGAAHGNSTVTYKNGEVIKSKFEEGYVNADRSQELILPNGCRFLGILDKNNSPVRGKCHFTEGETYEGEWKNNLPHGYGVTVDKNGDRHVGYFKNGLPNGYGKLCVNHGEHAGESLEINFVNGRPVGKGMLRWPDGSYCEITFNKDGTSYGIVKKPDLPGGIYTRWDKDGKAIKY